MARGTYSHKKRQREADKARKKQDKAERRMERRRAGPGEVPIAAAEDVAGNLPSIEEAMRAFELRAVAPRSAEPIPCRLFVGGLSWSIGEEQLRAAFAPFGEVSDAVVVNDRATGRSRGFAFVTMRDRKDAANAMRELNGSEIDGRAVVVNVATERQR